MYTKKQYAFWTTFYWSKKPFIIGFIFSFILLIVDYSFDFKVTLPWQPISTIGIAVAFYLGFRNNSSYDRLWEARKVYGDIFINSRAFGVGVTSFIQGKGEDKIKKELIYRHIAWLAALRFQLRISREWEHTKERASSEDYPDAPSVSEDYIHKLDQELNKYLPPLEKKTYENKSNIATQILATQAKRLSELNHKDYFNHFRHAELYKIITNLYAGQGKSERTKSFPFPKQYSSTANNLTLVFSILAPFGLLDIFKHSTTYIFIEYPLISALVIWIFCLMGKIGDYSENPFEGTYNDVPITAISRDIEIDLREMINDTNIPKPLSPKNGFLL